jgi:hypothetical protein
MRLKVNAKETLSLMIIMLLLFGIKNIGKSLAVSPDTYAVI